MKYFVIIVALFIFSAEKTLSAEKGDCTSFKKFSIKYTWCKSKNAATGIKNKIDSIKKDKTTNKMK